MTADIVAGVLFIFEVALIVISSSYIWGAENSKKDTQEQAIAAGCAHYHPKTGAFTWGAE